MAIGQLRYLLRAPYAMPGTDIPYGGTRQLSFDEIREFVGKYMVCHTASTEKEKDKRRTKRQAREISNVVSLSPVFLSVYNTLHGFERAIFS
eukprot:3935404-Rhodomonas_salina.1